MHWTIGNSSWCSCVYCAVQFIIVQIYLVQQCIVDFIIVQLTAVQLCTVELYCAVQFIIVELTIVQQCTVELIKVELRKLRLEGKVRGFCWWWRIFPSCQNDDDVGDGDKCVLIDFGCYIYLIAEKELPCTFNCGFVVEALDSCSRIVFIFCPDFFPTLLFSMTS